MFSIFNKYDSVYPLVSLSMEDMYNLITLKTRLSVITGKPEYVHIDEWPLQVKKFRDTLLDEHKVKLPGITFAGDMQTRTVHKKMSGYFCIDIDNKHGENPLLTSMGLELTKDYISCFDSCVLAFNSPSNKGIKVVHKFSLCGDRMEIRDAYRQVFAYYAAMYKSKDLNIDRSCSDPYRFCFISYDRNAYYDPNATTDSIELIAPPPAKPIVPCKDEDVNDKFVRAEERVRTVKGLDWSQGSKHHYLVTLAGMCKAFGIDHDTFTQVASHYIIDEKAAKSVKQIYN